MKHVLHILAVSVLLGFSAVPPCGGAGTATNSTEVLPPPLPPIPAGTNDTVNPVEHNSYQEALGIQLDPVCRACGTTNHYRVVLSVAPKPTVVLGIPLETSTNAVEGGWAPTLAEVEVPAEDPQRYFRSSPDGLKIRAPDPIKFTAINYSSPTNPEE